jgi:hypothetical protein
MAKAKSSSRKKSTTKAAPEAEGGVAKIARRAQARRDVFDAVLKRITTLRAREAEQWDDLWEAVGEAIEGEVPLYRAAYTSLEAFVKEELAGETARSVKRKVMVAGAFTAADYKQHGEGLLEELALFVKEQSGARVAPRAVSLDRVRVPVKAKGGGVTRKAARSCTIEEVRKARRGLAKGAPTASTPVRVKALKGAMAKVAALREVAVSERADGFVLSGVAEAAFRPLAKVLETVKLPPAATKG